MSTAPQFQFTKAARYAVKLKIGVDGPSGSGKTYGALSLAHGIAGGGQIAVADSENGSAALYADRFAFDTVAIPDASPDTYKAIIDAAVAGGYAALVIDSLSHAWLTILSEKEAYDRKQTKANPYVSWGIFGAKWENLMQHILHAPIHVIATMRSKQAYEQVERDGRKQVVKLGMQPQVREGSEYEFGLVFSVNQSHAAEASKDRTGLFADRLIDLADVKVHRELIAWMNAGGAAPAPAPRPQLVKPETDQVPEAASAPVHDVVWAMAYPFPFQRNTALHGRPMGELKSEMLITIGEWIVEKQKEKGDQSWNNDVLHVIHILLAEREKDQTKLALEEPLAAAAPATAVVNAPGKVADALTPNEPKVSVAPVSLTQIVATITALLQNEKWTDDERAAMRTKLDAAASLEQLQALATEIEVDLARPF